MPSIVFGIKHPKEALLYILLGRADYYELRLMWPHTCPSATPAPVPFAAHLSTLSDIHEHLVTLFMLTVELKLKTIVELGTKYGESTVALLFAAKRCGGKVYSYDIDECPIAKKTVAQYGLQEYWQFTQSDDLEAKWDEPIDHLFIDTTHGYEQTTRELQKFEPFVRRGGIITMHDPVSYPELRSATEAYLKDRDDLTLYEYVNNNGLFVIFKS